VNRTFLPAPLRVAVVIVAVGTLVSASNPAGPHALLQSPNQRTPAAEFALKNATGKAVRLHDYVGRSFCSISGLPGARLPTRNSLVGEFQRRYAEKGLAVVGVSLDDEGWKVVTPFVKSASIPYEILVGNEKTAKDYGISNMPDTFLIDREGRIAASYAGVVDKADVEKNIQTLLNRN
jgi:peroxiredoxin